MSIRPFSSNEIDNLREIIEKNGFLMNGFILNYFRCSISKNKVLIFTLKFPVHLPIRLNIPFEVVSFQVSLAFRIFHLNQDIYKVIIALMKMLKSLALQISIEHHFPIKGRENQLVDLLNLIIPELIKEENERVWLNRVRISLMNKVDRFKEFDSTKISEISNSLKNLELNPTFKIPWEFNKGIPKLRTSETLLFSNDEPEFFILEKGYFTYFKDLEYKKFYLRAFFESYSPYILNEIFSDNPDFKLEIFLETWIKFARLLLNSVIEVIDSINFNENEMVTFRPIKGLDVRDYEDEQINFPLSALHYESIITKELYPLHNNLFNTPPTNFEVMEFINYLTSAEELINNYKFKEATKILEDSLKIFNKYHQKKIVVSILLKLRKIASILNQSEIEINYLKSALEIAKSGEIPLYFIIRIHYELGKKFYKLKDYNNSLKHFTVILNFLKDEKDSYNKTEYIGLSSLYVGLIYQEQNNLTEAKTNFKIAFENGNKSLKVKLKYHLLRGRYFKNKDKISQAQKIFRIGLPEIKKGIKFHRSITIDLMLELSEFFIHFRKDTKKSIYYLESIGKILSKNNISGIKRALQWNLLMIDLYKFNIKDNQKATYYLEQSNILRRQLKTIGVIN